MADLKAFTSWISDYARVVAEQAEYLTDRDRAVGDGDHGANMHRGMKSAAELAANEGFPGIDAYLKKVGMTLVSTVGGASGPLYGTFFLRMGGALAGVADADAAQLGAALRAGVEGILARGKAQLEDKTMYDAWAPALEAYDAASGDGVGAARR